MSSTYSDNRWDDCDTRVASLQCRYNRWYSALFSASNNFSTAVTVWKRCTDYGKERMRKNIDRDTVDNWYKWDRPFSTHHLIESTTNVEKRRERKGYSLIRIYLGNILIKGLYFIWTSIDNRFIFISFNQNLEENSETLLRNIWNL